MSYYSTFVKTTRPPKTKWLDDLQAFVDVSFDNASTYQEDVEEEIAIGTLEFRPMITRVTSLVDAKTGQRINDDYKKIIFDNLDHHPEVGTRYKFDDNIWIAYSTDNIKTATAAVYVRRCNNVMTTQDIYGNIHREPVYIDYKVTENQLFRNYTVDVPSGRIMFQCQYNQYTKDININSRFIFGTEVYMVRERSGFDRRYTFDNDSYHMLSFYADLDSKAENDNFELGIANYKRYDYEVTCVDSIENVIGFTGKLSPIVYLNGQEVEESVYFESTDDSIATINHETGEYQFVHAGICSFVCYMSNRPNTKCIIDVKVEERVKPEYEDIIDPNVKVVKLNTTELYSIFEYKNGIATDTAFYINSDGVSNRNYRLTIFDGNHFGITNLKPCNDELVITCTNSKRKDKSGEFVKTILNVRLGGIV